MWERAAPPDTLATLDTLYGCMRAPTRRWHVRGVVISMAINTPPIASPETTMAPLQAILNRLQKGRLEQNQEICQLKTSVLSLRHDNQLKDTRIELLEQACRQLEHQMARLQAKLPPDPSYTSYSQTVSARPLPASSPSEQLQPEDISCEITHDLPELPAVESVGEEEDSTAIHQAISKAASVTSHKISREHPVMDLLTALSEHVQSCQQATSVIMTNDFVGDLLSKPLANFPDIKCRHNGLLRDDEFLCASYNNGGSHGTVSPAAPHLG